MTKAYVRLWNSATRRLPVALLGVASLAPSVFAQSTPNSAVAIDDPFKTCQVAEQADHHERDIVTRRKSPALDTALRSESAFWKFVIDPSTSYLDRMAAAYQGGGLIPATQLVRLWKASADFKVLPTGVNPPPCEFIANAWAARGPGAWRMRKTLCVYLACQTKPETRNVLGYEVRLPETAIDYPLDVESRNGAPWLWQMARALRTLRANVQEYYAHPDRYAQMAEVALRWHPDTFYEWQERAQALEQGPRNATWVRALMRAAIDDGGSSLAASVPPPTVSLYAYGDDTLHLQELMHVAHIAVIQQASDWSTAAGSANRLAEMKKRKPEGTNLSWFGWGPLRSATSVMAIAQWAMKPSLSMEQRYSFAHCILEIIDDPSFKPNSAANGQAQAEEVLHVQRWLYGNQAWLEQRVASEIDGLATVAAELGTHLQPPSSIETR